MCQVARHHFGQPRWANVWQRDDGTQHIGAWHISPLLADRAALAVLSGNRRVGRIKCRYKRERNSAEAARLYDFNDTAQIAKERAQQARWGIR